MSFRIVFDCEVEGGPSKLVEIDAQLGERLTAVAHRAGVVIQQTCAGVPSCTDCKVVVKEGVENGFEAPQGPEVRLMGNVFFITRERLSCQAIVKGDAKVLVPSPQGYRDKQQKRKDKFVAGRKQHSSEGEDRNGQKNQKENHQKSGEKSSPQENREESRKKNRS